MKKFFVLVFSLMILLCGGTTLSLSFLTSSAEEEVENKEKTISSSEEYVSVMSDESIYGNKNVIVKLENDIDLSGVDLGSVFAINSQFMGTFDGNGYTISSPKFNSNSQYFGLIPQASGATIKNVRVNGKVEYVFTPINVKELYVGILVGNGVNLTFLNCELDNAGEGENAKSYDIDLPIYSNINFGGLAGRIRYDYNNEGVVKDCVNYYNINITLIKDTSINLGGLVGSAESSLGEGRILNTLSFGNINITNNVSSSSAIGQVNLGGIVGGVGGRGAYIRNSLYGGSITRVNSVLNLNYNAGGIVGGILSPIDTNNINFVYYTDTNLKPSGDNSISQSDIVARIERIDRNFMTDTSNFDPTTYPWDFNKVWRLINSDFHLQNFQIFDFTFNNILDNGRIIDSANFIDKEGNSLKRINVKFDEEVVIDITFKQENYGYYILTSVNLGTNNSLDQTEYTFEEKMEEGVLSGYRIYLKANAVTAGTYSFTISPKGYSCIATIADEAHIKDEDGNIIDHQGGIRIDTAPTLGFEPVTITFYRDSRSRTITAEGVDIYVFDHWVMYEKDIDGQFTQEVELDSKEEPALTVAFGTAPFDKEFKLVAYFTKNAVNVSFGQSENIKSITFGGKTYIDEPLPISPNASQSLVVVVRKGYILDIDTFTRDIKALYGANSTSYLAPSSEVDEESGDTTYKFTINMRYISQFDNNELKLSFLIVEEKADGASSLLWLYITLPIVVVVAGAIVAVVIILKKRRADDDDSIGGGSGSGSGKSKAKKESYKDLF